MRNLHPTLASLASDLNLVSLDEYDAADTIRGWTTIDTSTEDTTDTTDVNAFLARADEMLALLDEVYPDTAPHAFTLAEQAWFRAPLSSEVRS